ncbi:MAG TPA: TPM domain-containing protein [Bacteroidia bacterium]|nr:TPM domain-containing protein [Bacteroidia bacterium]
MKRLLLFILAFPFLLNAQDFPAKPTNYVTDEANILSDEQELSLNTKLRNFEDSSTNQIFVYIASSLNGNDLSDLSQNIFHTWKIGQDGKNNGVLIAIFIDDHKFRIQTGYGLEGVLPDIVTKHIQDNDMRPLFKQNQYFEGIDKGVDQLIYYSKHEFKVDDINEEESTAGLFIFFYAFSAAFLLVTILLTRKIQDKPTAKKVLIISSIICFIIPFLGTFILLMMVFIALSYRKDLIKTSSISTWTSSSDSSWGSNDSSSSWSSSDSDSGSSFDGGGGGDSGGGGSSSDW